MRKDGTEQRVDRSTRGKDKILDGIEGGSVRREVEQYPATDSAEAVCNPLACNPHNPPKSVASGNPWMVWKEKSIHWPPPPTL